MCVCEGSQGARLQVLTLPIHPGAWRWGGVLSLRDTNLQDIKGHYSVRGQATSGAVAPCRLVRLDWNAECSLRPWA